MKRKVLLLVSIIVLAFALTACGTDEETNNKAGGKNNSGNKQQTEELIDENTYFPQLTTEVKENEIVAEMITSMGTIKLKLFPDLAPKAVENFVTHSKNGYYDGVTFHRVIKDFMIQGGDPKGTGRGGESIWGKPFADEISNKLFNIRGALSMANAGANTNGSQFFIVQNTKIEANLIDEMKIAGYPDKVIEAYKNGGTPWLDGKHTVFGQVIEGMDVVDKIAAVKTGADDKPVEDVVIETIKVKK